MIRGTLEPWNSSPLRLAPKNFCTYLPVLTSFFSPRSSFAGSGKVQGLCWLQCAMLKVRGVTGNPNPGSSSHLLYSTLLYSTLLYSTLLYYTILYYTILYYTILYYTILYYTISLSSVQSAAVSKPSKGLGVNFQKDVPLTLQTIIPVGSGFERPIQKV